MQRPADRGADVEQRGPELPGLEILRPDPLQLSNQRPIRLGGELWRRLRRRGNPEFSLGGPEHLERQVRRDRICNNQ